MTPRARDRLIALALLRLLRDFARRLWHPRVAALSTSSAYEASQFAGLEHLYRIAAEQAAGYAAVEPATEPIDMREAA